MASRHILPALLLAALLAGCSGPGPRDAPLDAHAPTDAPASPTDGGETLPAPDATGPATAGAPWTQVFTQTWAAQAGGVYVLRTAEPVVDLALNASAVLVEARWEADQSLPGGARLVVTGPQGEWAAARGAGDLRVELPAGVGGHQATLRLDLDEAGSAAVGMRATYYVTSFAGPADPDFTALP